MRGLFFFFVLFAWWVCVNAHSSKQIEQRRKTIESRFEDDSGSKLRDKEQQRLSSK